MDTPADLWKQRYASSDRVWSGLLSRPTMLGLLSLLSLLSLLTMPTMPSVLGVLGPPALPASGSWSATSRASRMSRRTISSTPASCSPRSRSRGS